MRGGTREVHRYSRGERAADAVVHALGFAAALAACSALAAAAPRPAGIRVVVHLSTRLPYHTALWHALVLAAAACHYAVVFRLATVAG